MDRLPRTARLLPILLLWSTASVADDYRLGSRGEVLDDRVLYTLGGGSAGGAPTARYRPPRRRGGSAPPAKASMQSTIWL